MYRRNQWAWWQVALATAAALYFFFDLSPRPHTAAFLSGFNSDQVSEGK
jgi:hypothetical protein